MSVCLYVRDSYSTYLWLIVAHVMHVSWIEQNHGQSVNTAEQMATHHGMKPTQLQQLNQMDFFVPALTWMLSLTRRPAVTLTFDLQNLIRSSVGASEYSV